MNQRGNLKPEFFILFFITIWISVFIFGCQRFVPSSDARQDKGLAEIAKKKSRKPPEIVKRDGRYLKYDNGVVYDEAAGLEWYAGPDVDTNFDAARSWVETLTVAGGNWRMPAPSELKKLYEKGAGKANMTPLLKTTGMWVWAGEIKDSSAWTFNYEYGYGHWDFRSNESYFRAFAVRRR